jgi:hypothetical protein
MYGEPRFPLGRIFATPGVLESVSQAELLDALGRHASGDWGAVGDDDRRANDAALRNGERLLSAYVTGSGTKFWIITEADRSATTALLPDEY